MDAQSARMAIVEAGIQIRGGFLQRIEGATVILDFSAQTPIGRAQPQDYLTGTWVAPAPMRDDIGHQLIQR